MSKVRQILENNAITIICSLVIILVLFSNTLYTQNLKGDIVNLNNDVVNLQDTVYSQFILYEATNQSLNIMSDILEVMAYELEDIRQLNRYIIDQNRADVSAPTQSEATQGKPTYEELKAHTVYIIGCSGKTIDQNKLTYPIGDDGVCWSGTGVVVKITDTETYILTNNHVAGNNQDKVTLYVENNDYREKAEVIKYHSYDDLAVIKISVPLKDKTPITKIATANVQDSVYIVGHPLGNKYSYTEGVVANYTGISILVQAPCIYGNSGSGLFSASGELVGLVFALEGYSGFLGFPQVRITHSLCVDSITIKIFLEELGLYNE